MDFIGIPANNERGDRKEIQAVKNVKYGCEKQNDRKTGSSVLPPVVAEEIAWVYMMSDVRLDRLPYNRRIRTSVGIF